VGGLKSKGPKEASKSVVSPRVGEKGVDIRDPQLRSGRRLLVTPLNLRSVGKRYDR